MKWNVPSFFYPASNLNSLGGKKMNSLSLWSCGLILQCLVVNINSSKEYSVSIFRSNTDYSETLMYQSRIYHIHGATVQFLWPMNKSYLNYSSHIYHFQISIIPFQGHQQEQWIKVSLYSHIQSRRNYYTSFFHNWVTGKGDWIIPHNQEFNFSFS